MSLPTFTIDDILSWNPCEGYDRPTLVILLGGGPISALNILDLMIPIQDRMWVICREAVVGGDGLATLDAWVTSRFDEIEATTLEGQNCKNNWPRPDEFQRASMLAAFMGYETGSDAQFVDEIRIVLEGV